MYSLIVLVLEHFMYFLCDTWSLYFFSLIKKLVFIEKYIVRNGFYFYFHE